MTRGSEKEGVILFLVQIVVEVNKTLQKRKLEKIKVKFY